MTDLDPVLRRLAELPPSELDSTLAMKITSAAHRTLAPRRVHPICTVAAAACVLSYLCWAVYFASRLY